MKMTLHSITVRNYCQLCVWINCHSLEALFTSTTEKLPFSQAAVKGVSPLCVFASRFTFKWMRPCRYAQVIYNLPAKKQPWITIIGEQEGFVWKGYEPIHWWKLLTWISCRWPSWQAIRKAVNPPCPNASTSPPLEMQLFRQQGSSIRNCDT